MDPRFLTERQTEVLRRLCAGESIEAVAAALGEPLADIENARGAVALRLGLPAPDAGFAELCRAGGIDPADPVAGRA